MPGLGQRRRSFGFSGNPILVLVRARRLRFADRLGLIRHDLAEAIFGQCWRTVGASGTPTVALLGRHLAGACLDALGPPGSFIAGGLGLAF